MSDTGRPSGPDQRPGTGAGDGTSGDAAGGRPRWLLPVVGGGVALLVVGAVVAILVTRGGDAEPAAVPTATVTLPVPTPAVEPAARPATTAFAAALPTTVLQYALEASADDAPSLGAGALEAYAETFTDGDGGTLAVTAAQLETPEEAEAFLQRLVGELPAADAPAADAPAEDASDDATANTSDTAGTATGLPATGEVRVGEDVVGTYTVVDAGDGTGVAVWRNATAVFRLTAPTDVVLDAYTAYGL